MDDALGAKLKFISEQLALAGVKKNGRRYSPDLLACAMMWKCTSTALYKQILQQELICLPSLSHLTRLSSALSMTTGFSESRVKYLTARIKTLDDYERFVMFLIDEVYTKAL